MSYCRVPGDDGGVDAVAGPPHGKPLDQLISVGPPPWRVSLEILAALCEIADIAEEDRRAHGRIRSGAIFLDERGYLSVHGFADTEGSFEGDRYGIGRVAIDLLSMADAPDAPGPPDLHEPLVERAILAMRRDGLDADAFNDVVWYVHRLLSADPTARPTALEAWRGFVVLIADAPGPSLTAWAPQAMTGGGLRRDLTDLDPTTEQLRSAARLPGPLDRPHDVPPPADPTLAWSRPAPSPTRTEARPRRRTKQRHVDPAPAPTGLSAPSRLPRALALGGAAAALFVGGGMLAVLIALLVWAGGAS